MKLSHGHEHARCHLIAVSLETGVSKRDYSQQNSRTERIIGDRRICYYPFVKSLTILLFSFRNMLFPHIPIVKVNRA